MEIGKDFLYLTRKDVENVNIPMSEIIDILEEAFVEKYHGRVEMPPKPGIHPVEDAYIHAMPCWVPKHKAAGIKWVSGYPENQKRGLPYNAGFIVMNDPDTGLPLAVMDCTWVTTMRTGGVTGLSAKFLANPDSEVVGILGCGVQGRSNLEALAVACKNLKRVYAFDIYPEIAQKYAEEQAVKYKLEIIPVKTQKEAVQDSDIIVTAGPIKHNPDRAIEGAWLKKGVFLAPVDFDCMYMPSVIEEYCARCFVDDLGQYQGFKKLGYFPYGPEALPEICTVFAGKVKGREDRDEKVAAANIGMALDDMPVAIKIFETAKAKGLGTVLPL